MKRRAFFQNLVGSFAVLVSAYALPIHRITRRDPFTDFLIRESGRFAEDALGRRTFEKSIWMTLIKPGKFPEGMGNTIRNA